MVDIADSAVSPKDIGTSPEDIAKRWHMEIKLARKAREKWQKRAKRIVQRYRDERPSEDEVGYSKGTTRFNVLWSNVQTLLPAIYAKAPKPVVERRFLDKDPIGRTASRILERCLMYTIEAGYYHESLRKAVLDYLLPGQGTVWARYEPTYEDGPPLTATDDEASDGAKVSKTEANYRAGDGDRRCGGCTMFREPASCTKVSGEISPDALCDYFESREVVADELVCTDYVHWEDFLANAARTCDELRWVGKRAFLTRDQLTKRFPKVGKEVPLNYSPKDLPINTDKTGNLDEMFKKAEVWEIWNKDDKKVYFISEHFNKPLEVADDPLNLEGFWPTPNPLLATVANDSIVPTPDYVEYQDQAIELDSLTARIAALTKAIKAVGVYDASVPALKRLLEEGSENVLYPVESWAEFAQKRGMEGSVDLLPIKEMAEVLIRLYEARAQVKNDLHEITGISDIVRGQATQGGAKTATEQRIKGQFANLRLSDRQAAVAIFARDQLRIIAEIIAEHFSPQTLLLMSGYQQWGMDQFIQQPPQQPPQQPQQPPMLPNAPQGGLPGGAAAQSLPAAPPPPDPQQMAMQQFQAAIDLLKKDKLRGFRVDIETDSTIEPDAAEEKQARVEFLGAVAQFLPQAIEAGAMNPAMVPLMGKMLLFGVRGFRVGRELESAMEETIQQMEKQAANPQPKPPSPEEIKVQGEMQKQQMEAQRSQMDAQLDQQSRQQELQMKQQEAAMEMQNKQQELEFKKAELALKFEELQMKRQDMMLQSQIKHQDMAMQAQASEQQHELDSEAMTQKHEMGLEALEAKTQAAKQQAKQKPGARA